MFVVAGYVVVIACVFGGYALAGGHFAVIAKAAPVELFIICGAALGAFLCTDASSGMTGQTIFVDAGCHAVD